MELYYHIYCLNKKGFRFKFYYAGNASKRVSGSVEVTYLNCKYKADFDIESNTLLSCKEKELIVGTVLKNICFNQFKQASSNKRYRF